ncbi:uncharacterized protein LTR77_004516 [Saxophila tyrrhenica]|uniref:Fork-head domain-containing protein n=1 Tax=Saxophila tyrrhenica TaxID=1690608 RepID=A0AAV9PGC9_9PEZI|nr:hypothetical protein LTR77_004516 [Saxophila tyrrhenica]
MASTTMVKSPSIKARIRTAIAPWRLGEDEPDFTYEQLVVMAILMNDGEASEVEIHKWVLDTFSFYREQLARALRVSTRKERWNHSFQDYFPHTFHHGLNLTFQGFETPLREVMYEGSGSDTSDSGDDENDGRIFSVTDAAGAEFLCPIFPHPPRAIDTSAFDFFALPAELRGAIYGIVFSYPKSGLATQLCRKREPFYVSSRTREYEHAVSWEDCDILQGARNSETAIRTRPMEDILEPLLVSKQFYAEAMPVFYRTNNFHATSTSVLYHMLIRMAPNRLQHLTQISFQYHGNFGTETTKAFAILAQLDHLKKLDIFANKQEWIGRGSFVPSSKRYSSVMNMDGVDKLRAIRGLDRVTFHGSPTLERELKPDMLKPKTKKKSTRAGTKRKGDGREHPLTFVVKEAKAKKPRRTYQSG